LHGKNPDGYVLHWEKDAPATFLAGGRAKMEETISSILNQKQPPKKQLQNITWEKSQEKTCSTQKQFGK